MAMLPEPPARLSMTTVWPVLAVMCAPRKRARMSVIPPGEVETTILIGFVGYDWALAKWVAATPSATAVINRKIIDTLDLLPWLVARRFQVLQIVLARRFERRVWR